VLCGKTYAYVGGIGCTVSNISFGRVSPARLLRSEDCTGGPLGSEWFLAAHARLPGANGLAVDSSGKSSPSPRRRHLFSEPPLYFDTLAAYVGETVTLRFDPRDMAEIRVFHNDRFLCQAVCAELAGATVPLREILRTRNQRRRELRGILRNRQSAVDTLLAIKRGEATEKQDATAPEQTPPAKQPPPTLKRYRNE